MLSILVLCFLVGLQHAMEADHLAGRVARERAVLVIEEE